jgi:hypothetical protein
MFSVLLVTSSGFDMNSGSSESNRVEIISGRK